MERPSKDQWIKRGFAVSVVVILLGLLTIFACNQPKWMTGEKEFTVEVISERDNFSQTDNYASSDETLGDFLREQEWVEYQDSSYGMYITSVYYPEDMENQYWWCIIVDGEAATTGADEIPLEDGSVYILELKQGW